jgi:hypothetical protein
MRIVIGVNMRGACLRVSERKKLRENNYATDDH